jgi:hypothetical protein
MQNTTRRGARRGTAHKGAPSWSPWGLLWRAVALAGTAWLCSAMAEMPTPPEPTSASAPR